MRLRVMRLNGIGLYGAFVPQGTPDPVCGLDFHDREDFSTAGSTEPFAIMEASGVAGHFMGAGRGGAAGPAGAAHVDADRGASGAEGGAFG